MTMTLGAESGGGVIARIVAFLFAITAFAWPLAASAASLNCSKSETLVDKAICSNAELSALDDQLGDAYRAAVNAAINKEQVRLDGREWLTQVRNRCSDTACLLLAYRNRVKELNERSLGRQIVAPSPGQILAATQAYTVPPKLAASGAVSAEGKVLGVAPSNDGSEIQTSYGKLTVNKREVGGHRITLEGRVLRDDDANSTSISRLYEIGNSVVVLFRTAPGASAEFLFFLTLKGKSESSFTEPFGTGSDSFKSELRDNKIIVSMPDGSGATAQFEYQGGSMNAQIGPPTIREALGLGAPIPQAASGVPQLPGPSAPITLPLGGGSAFASGWYWWSLAGVLLTIWLPLGFLLGSPARAIDDLTTRITVNNILRHRTYDPAKAGVEAVGQVLFGGLAMLLIGPLMIWFHVGKPLLHQNDQSVETLCCLENAKGLFTNNMINLCLVV